MASNFGIILTTLRSIKYNPHAIMLAASTQLDFQGFNGVIEDFPTNPPNIRDNVNQFATHLGKQDSKVLYVVAEAARLAEGDNEHVAKAIEEGLKKELMSDQSRAKMMKAEAFRDEWIKFVKDNSNKLRDDRLKQLQDYFKSSQLPQQSSSSSATDAVGQSSAICNVTRGRAVVINNVDFSPPTSFSSNVAALISWIPVQQDAIMAPREGSDNDAQELLETLSSFGFIFHRYNAASQNRSNNSNNKNETRRPSQATDYGIKNAKSRDIGDLVAEIKADREGRLAEADCFVLVLMSHGNKKGEFKTYDGWLDYQKTLIDPFSNDKCPQLRGKPKIFLIQASWGHGASRVSAKADRPDSAASLVVGNSVPFESDVLIVYVTVPDNTSFREDSSSWFLHAVIEALKKPVMTTPLSLQEILLTVASHQVTTQISNSPDPNLHEKKQCAVIVNRLRHVIYLQLPSA